MIADGDEYTVMDVIARQVGAIGLFSDWPATVTRIMPIALAYDYYLLSMPEI